MSRYIKHSVFVIAAAAFGIVVCTAQSAPKSVSDLRKQVFQKTPVVIQPLMPSVKLARVKQILNGKTGAKPLSSTSIVDSVTLSVSAPVANGNAVGFSTPLEVLPSDGLAVFIPIDGTPLPPSLFITYNAPADGVYIFDFSVAYGAADPANETFSLVYGDGKIQTLNAATSDKHILLIVQNIKAGNGFYMLSSDRHWNFHSVTISQLKL